MQALAFWKAVVADKADFLESLTALLADHAIRYCAIGGVGVNAYAAPRLRDLADIARLLEVHPELRAGVPREILERLR